MTVITKKPLFFKTVRMFPVLLFCFIMSGCETVDNVFGKKDPPPLEGERLTVLELEQKLEPDDSVLDAQGFIAPPAWENEFWPQAGGYPNHAMQHLELSSGILKQVWSADIGAGASKSLPLTSMPIIVDGMVYTLDPESTIAVFSVKDGKKIWSRNIKPENEDEEVISGGLAYSGGWLFATNGYNELIAIDSRAGKTMWRIRLPAPSRAAPTVMDGRVFVSTIDNRLLAYGSEAGELLWEFSGVYETAGLLGTASPAANRDIVLPAFSSGDIYALRVENGSVGWSENLAPITATGGLPGLSDIRGMPVIDKGAVFAVSYGGRILSIEERTGKRIWQKEIGSSEMPWLAGNHLFLISSDSKAVALGRDSGSIRWVTELQRYEKPEKRKDQIIWTGPVLAGGRLIAAGSNGHVIELNADTGAIIREWNSGHSVAVSPIVAGKTLFLLSSDGTLSAWR